MKSLFYAFRDRRNRKRDFRRLWTTRINAASRINGLSYSRLIYGLKLANVQVDRKVLADIAVYDSAAFTKLVDLAKAQLADLLPVFIRSRRRTGTKLNKAAKRQRLRSLPF